eukprot:TRINITY_DN9064_c0_g1_i1.p6 TRINITY_DN9064_c0_g1~~TRINITY_DN9064_c0_g1_i1.p6  ORF type:complete len:102 (+),score=10.92 TRINITY_DN9064_c0_g1_i1:437-742(+)
MLLYVCDDAVIYLFLNEQCSFFEFEMEEQIDVQQHILMDGYLINVILCGFFEHLLVDKIKFVKASNSDSDESIQTLWDILDDISVEQDFDLWRWDRRGTFC